MRINPVLAAHLALFLVNTLYAASHVLAKGVMPEYLSPNVFILFRVFGATLLFWIIAGFNGIQTIERSDWFRLVACAAFGVAINQLFFFHGLNLSSSINSGIIMAMNPIMVVLLSFVVLKEALNSWKIAGILSGSIGAVLLTLSSGASTNASYWGDAFLVINSASYAIYLVLAKPMMKKYNPLSLITWIFTLGLIMVVIFPPTSEEVLSTDFQQIPSAVWFKIVYVVVGVTFLTYLLTMYGLKHLSASVSSSYIYVQPVLVILFAYVLSFMGWSADYTATITSEKVALMLLIFFGVYAVTKSSNTKG
jgi:drug/metabolite transporter (DMT)-like permease